MPNLGNQISIDQYINKPQSEWPPWLNELIYEIAFKRMPLKFFCDRYKLSRRVMDDFLAQPEVIQKIKEIRAKAYAKLQEELDAIQLASIEVLEQVLSDGKIPDRLKAAIEVLRGLGKLKDHSDITGNITVVIDKELTQENK